MTSIIDGRQIAAELQFRLRQRLQRLGKIPNLVAILVGDNPASSLYVAHKRREAQKIGICAGCIQVPADYAECNLLALIHNLNRDTSIHGILVQLPLPPHIDSQRIAEAFDPVKDVDGFHPINVSRLSDGTALHVPCTPKGILKLLEVSGVLLPACRVLIIGCGTIVGRPLATLLTRAGATVTIAHKLTQYLAFECQRAEVIIAAAGCPNLVRGHHMRPGTVVIDVGINRVDGKLVGDVAFDECLGIAKAITPVPGGVGPMTVACLMENTIEAAAMQQRTACCNG